MNKQNWLNFPKWPKRFSQVEFHSSEAHLHLELFRRFRLLQRVEEGRKEVVEPKPRNKRVQDFNENSKKVFVIPDPDAPHGVVVSQHFSLFGQKVEEVDVEDRRDGVQQVAKAAQRDVALQLFEEMKPLERVYHYNKKYWKRYF